MIENTENAIYSASENTTVKLRTILALYLLTKIGGHEWLMNLRKTKKFKHFHE